MHRPPLSKRARALIRRGSKMRLKNLKRSGVATPIGTLMLAGGATSASAVESDAQACAEYGWNYSTYTKTDIHIPSGVHWKDGPGGTVSASRESTQSASMTVSMSVSVSYS